MTNLPLRIGSADTSKCRIGTAYQESEAEEKTHTNEENRKFQNIPTIHLVIFDKIATYKSSTASAWNN